MVELYPIRIMHTVMMKNLVKDIVLLILFSTCRYHIRNGVKVLHGHKTSLLVDFVLVWLVKQLLAQLKNIVLLLHYFLSTLLDRFRHMNLQRLRTNVAVDQIQHSKQQSPSLMAHLRRIIHVAYLMNASKLAGRTP
jgi:hypothetical protein